MLFINWCINALNDSFLLLAEVFICREEEKGSSDGANKKD